MSVHERLAKYKELWTTELHLHILVETDSSPAGWLLYDIETGGAVLIDCEDDDFYRLLGERLRAAGIRRCRPRTCRNGRSA